MVINPIKLDVLAYLDEILVKKIYNVLKTTND